MESWDLAALSLKPRLPEILASTDAARAIVLDLAPGERLPEHEVHEHSWIVVVSGRIELTAGAGARTVGGPGLLVQVPPSERHELRATAQSRLLLLLTPWPGDGHPGAMSFREKLYARRHAAKRAAGQPGADSSDSP
ncbi:MAG: cupin domain-containing protein [Solirubrobacterales bacterium]|nr:cupin domain-containing protein [Solirubrobacterales bacterium]